MTGVLVKKDIISERLIEVEKEFEEDKCYKPASYDLRLGSEFYFPKTESETVENYHHKGNEIGNCEGSFITIPPYSSIIISSLEKVRLPNNVVGRFDLRVKWALKGLIFQNGTQVEPGYYGRLFGLILNLSDTPRNIRHGEYDDRIFTIEFKYTTHAADVPNKKNNPPLIKFLDDGVIVGGLDKFMSTAQIVSEKAKEASEAALKSRLRRWEVFVAGILLIATLAISIIAPLNIANYVENRESYLDIRNDIMKEFHPTNSTEIKREEQIIDELKRYSIIKKNLSSIDADDSLKSKELIDNKTKFNEFVDNRIQELLYELNK